MRRLLHTLSARILAVSAAALVGLTLSTSATAADWVVSRDVAPPEPTELHAPPADWDVATGPFVRVYGASHQYRTVLRLARHASEALPRLALELGVPIGDTVHIYMAPTDAEFRKMQPGNAPSWADATAYASIGAIYLRGPGARPATDEPLEQVLEHELVHILLGRAFAPEIVPSWLQEGVAQVMAKQTGPQTAQTISRHASIGGPIPLSELTRGFPVDPVRAQLAYAQSADFIEWMRITYGPESLRTLVDELGKGRSVDGALYAATGEFLPTVEGQYRATLASGLPLSLSWAMNTDAMFALGGIMLLIGGVLRRRRFHQRLAEMEAEEALVDELVAAVRAERDAHFSRMTA